MVHVRFLNRNNALSKILSTILKESALLRCVLIRMDNWKDLEETGGMRQKPARRWVGW